MSNVLRLVRPAATSGRHNLPAPATRVVGRGEVIAALERALRTQGLVSIVGAGGIGKTTVALAVAERLRDGFADGVWLVDFAPLRDPALVPHAIAGATGLAVHSANILDALCRFLRARELLLVLDNCEHMVDAIAACVLRIRAEAPGVHVLLTSRTALRIADEQVQKLAGLPFPPQSAGLSAAQALAYPAVELFVERATDRLDTFVLGDGEAAAVADICRSLDGIALAIELAAMRIDVFGVPGLRQQLGDRFGLLAGRRAGLERHRTLLATLDWSYGLLSSAEAALLRAIAVFPGAFRLAGAARVAQVTPAVAAAILAELGAQSLLSVDAGAGAGADADATSYRALETTRAYCLDKLVAATEDGAARQRHAGYVCAVVQEAAAHWGQQVSRDWGAAYGGFLDDLRAALAWAARDAGQRALQISLTAAGTLLWNHFSLTDESRIHLTQAIAQLDAAGQAGTAIEMNLQFALAGAILYTRGTVPETRLAILRAKALSEQLGDTDFLLRCLRLAATIDLFSGDHLAGIATLETFLSIASTEDPSVLAEGETHLSVGDFLTGRLLAARARMEGLAARESPDFDDARFARFQYSNSVAILVMLSHAQSLTGQVERAASMAETILAYGRAANHELSLSIALAWNCLLYFWLGRDAECGEQAALLDELVERHGIVTWRPIATFCRGALAVRRDPASRAGIEELQLALAQFEATGHRARLPFYIAVLAEALGKQARYSEAAATVARAVTLATVQHEQWCLPEILRIEAGIAAAQLQGDAAERLLLASIALSQQIGALTWQLRAAHDLAVLWRTQARTGDATRVLQAAYDGFAEGFATRELVAAAGLLAELRQAAP